MAAIVFYPRKDDGTLDLEAAEEFDDDGQPPPTAEELRIPDEVWKIGHTSRESGNTVMPSVSWVLLWWTVWRRRQEEDGWSDGELLDKYREAVTNG